jgi:urease accessory protein
VPSPSPSPESQRLQWFSPAFPVGGYAYSHGIEKAVETGHVRDAATLQSWIEAILRHGAGRNDAILIGEVYRVMAKGGTGRDAALLALAELAYALGTSAERRLESAQQGAAFYALVSRVSPHADLPQFEEAVVHRLPYAITVGMAGSAHGHDVEPLAQAYLQSFASNLLAAGLRLGVIGQSGAQVALAALHPVLQAVAALAQSTGLDDLGGMVFRADLMSTRHETQTTRLFRS